MKTSPIKILGIDPGINNTGWNISVFNPNNGKLIVSTYGKFQANMLAKKEMRQENKVYGNIVSLFLYEREIKSIFDSFQPDYVASEDAFYNPRTPNAYLSLKLCINAIQRVLFTYSKVLYRIPPTVAKQAVWGNGSANKAAVQDSIQRLDDLIIKSTKQNPIEKMVEHEADSIAVSYAFTKTVLPDLLLQKTK